MRCVRRPDLHAPRDEGDTKQARSRHRSAQADSHRGRRRLQRSATAQVTVGNTTSELIRLLDWAQQRGGPLRWAVEDCRHVAGALLRALVGAGQTVVLVPTKVMAAARSPCRTRGKSDPIDALAVARAALREPELPEGARRRPSRRSEAPAGPP
ncbi:transposase [Catellatospora sp. NPDC049609]|uniref:IS110 family transposase n=1 Tax=Catellatospora sp. NPDC049609 TaxID=3155505 RepID=UPI0034353A8C